MALPPLGRFLVVSPWDVDKGVYVPELQSRLHELPAADQAISLVGTDVDRKDAGEWLARGGRSVEIADVGTRGPAPATPRYRLWNPHPCVVEIAIGEGRALDLGCGSGRDAVCLAASGWDVTAVDVLPDALDRAQDLRARYAPLGTLRTLHVRPEAETYDLVTMIRYFDPLVFAQLDRQVNPGGRVLIETYSEDYRSRRGHPKNASLVLTADLVATQEGSFRVERWEEGPVWTRLMMIRR